MPDLSQRPCCIKCGQPLIVLSAETRGLVRPRFCNSLCSVAWALNQTWDWTWDESAQMWHPPETEQTVSLS